MLCAAPPEAIIPDQYAAGKMEETIDMTNGPVHSRIKIKREAGNETPSCGHVRCINVCSGFLGIVET